MNIAVDASAIHSQYTGVGRYLYNLLKYISLAGEDIRFTLFCSEDFSLGIDNPGIEKIILKTTKGNLYWQNFILNRELKKGKFDLLWSPNYYSPVFYNGKSVLSMHDVSWAALPDNYSFPNRFVRGILSRISLKKASAVFTLSDFSKSEILRYYNAHPGKIRVIHLAADDSFRRSEKDAVRLFRKKYHLEEGPVIGFLGSIFKRRNIDVLIRSVGIVRKQYPGLKLILIGEVHDPAVEDLLNRDPSVILRNRISDDEMNDFYSSLDLFVYISEYEGFGLPPLEALKCGTVPLLLRKTSLKEIFPDIALFIDHAGTEKLSEEILRYFSNKEEVSDAILSRFLKRSDHFTWHRAAEEYIEAFKGLVNPET